MGQRHAKGFLPYYLLALFMTFTVVVNAQQKTVQGTVTDETEAPLPGVTVVVKGTNQGTITDADGNYPLEVPADAEVLSFSFIGMAPREIEIGNQTVINVSLESKVIGLQEVVAVGYSTRKAGEVTGSVSSVQTEDIEDMAAVSASETLKGNVSGVDIIKGNTPGEGADIRIRGLGTINNNDPLWVVDGVPGGNVNPSNIESISILKDASAQAIYGARASNGVVLVTTKSGKQGQETRVDVNVKRGISRNVNSYNLLNTQEYGEMLWMEARNANGGTLPDGFSHPQYGSGDSPSIPNYILPAGAEEVDHSLYDNQMIHEDGDDTYLIMKANKEGTDWLDAADQDAAFQEYSVNVSGGSETTNYAFQVGYLEEEGIMKYTDYKRYNLRSNVTANPTDWLEVGEKIGVTYSKDMGMQSNNQESSPISWTYRMQPIVPVYDIKGNFAGSRAEGMGNGENVLFNLYSQRNNWNKGMNVSGNTYAEINPIEGLTLKSLFGVNYDASQSRNLSYVEKAHAERGKYRGLSESDWFGMQWNWSNTLQYSKTFAGMHDITAMAGTEAINNVSRWRGASRDEFFSGDPNYMQLDAGVQNQSNYGNSSEWSLFSMFGRLNYTLDEKYILEGVIRRDGSSRFGEGGNYGVFPAFSAGWRISNEEFMSFTDNWLDFMKLRFGYGQTGNDQIGNYNAYTTYASNIGAGFWEGGGSYYPINGVNQGGGAAGFKRDAFGNPSVQWESTSTYNLAVDLTVLDNFDISVDVWKRITEDMLYPEQIPDVRGQASAPSVNVGEMENNGIDVELGYSGSGINNELKYNVALNVSRYQNEVVKLSGEEGEFIQGNSFREMVYARAEAGTQFPEFYGYVVEGIFQSEEEANNHPEAFGGGYNQEGAFKYKDVNGDGAINADDRTYIGSPHPDFTGGFNFSASYKNFRLSTRLYGSYGNEMVNYVRRWIDFNQFLGNRSERRLYKSYDSPYLDNNENAEMPIARDDDTNDQLPSTYFVEDASYLRMQNLKLSYDLSSIFGDETFRNIIVYGQVNNVFTITDYSGLDPEVRSGGINKGVDRGSWPTSRRFLLGLNLGF